jgi:F0F1-type ATP synthase assembly protein I
VDFRGLDGLAAENAVRLLAHFIVGIVLGYVLDRVSVFVRQEL